VETLFDYLTYTKSVGYIVAGLFLVGFIPFWKFLTERENGDRLHRRGTR